MDLTWHNAFPQSQSHYLSVSCANSSAAATAPFPLCASFSRCFFCCLILRISSSSRAINLGLTTSKSSAVPRSMSASFVKLRLNSGLSTLRPSALPPRADFKERGNDKDTTRADSGSNCEEIKRVR